MTTTTLLHERTRENGREVFVGLRAAPAQVTAGTSAGVNVAPGSDDDGWIVPPPARLADGTLVQLYKDGEALHAAYRAIERATRRVWLEIYIFHSDETGRAFAELLARRAREGLEVRVIYDSLGSIDADRAMFDKMRRAGVESREFHPCLPWRCKDGRWRPFQRDHRKLLVVDDEIGILGGQNLGDEYGSSWVVGRSDREAWRDTAAGVRGASVRLLSSVRADHAALAANREPRTRAEMLADCPR